VSDVGLIHIKTLRQLRKLYLAQTRVTNAGLTHLSGLMSLNYLWLPGTEVTDKGRKRLKQYLPNYKVVINGDQFIE